MINTVKKKDKLDPKKEESKPDKKEIEALTNKVEDLAKNAVEETKAMFKEIELDDYPESALITAAAIEFEGNKPDNVYFHGTDTEFDSVSLNEVGKRDTGNQGSGFYISTSPRTSQAYAEQAAEKSKKNPLLKTIVIDNGKFLSHEVALALIKEKLGLKFNPDNLEDSKKIRDLILSHGYDGIGEGSAELVVFNPAIIKMGKTYNGIKDLLGLDKKAA